MRVTIGQINTTNGDYAGNVERVLRAIERARADKSDLVVLPEVALQGYMSFDWFLDRDVIAHVTEPLEQIIEASAGLTVVVGTVRPNDSGQGRKLFNSAAVIRDGKLLGFADKTLLPEYDVFDDPRYFEPAKERHLFENNGMKVGVAVCEDFWNDKTFWRERLYTNDPADEVIHLGAEVLISINASPFNKGKMEQRCEMVSHRSRLSGLPIVFVNLVGANDSVIFDGASIVTDCRGEVILQAPPFEEFYGSVDLDCGVRDERCLPGDDIAAVHDALVLGIRDYARKNRFERAVLGLSGGIDSAVVAALACEAIGARDVLSVMMPSPFSSRGSVEDSIALGYCTLYGDTNGGLAVIGDVLKTEVYQLARYINREREIIPAAIIDKRPSAELAPDQFDDQSLPPYDQLDPIIKLYFEQKAP